MLGGPGEPQGRKRGGGGLGRGEGEENREPEEAEVRHNKEEEEGVTGDKLGAWNKEFLEQGLRQGQPR